MTLTLSHGPLSGDPPRTVNYRVEGPEHRLLFEEFPRRVRAVFAGETVVDTKDGMLLHETGHLPQLYAPRADLREDLLRATDHHTHCPFKGDASYWSVGVDGHTADNAVWAYPKPMPAAEWLNGYAAIYWGSMDAWFDEDEQITGLCDPYHRVDVRDSSRHVRVTADGAVLAETRRPKLLFETGLGNRFYIPPDEVRRDLLEPTEKQTICPYKGTASYWSVVVEGRRIDDAAWAYPQPLEAMRKAGDHISFSGDGIAIEVDGERVE